MKSRSVTQPPGIGHRSRHPRHHDAPRMIQQAMGAVTTAVLFTLGEFAIGFHLGRSNVGSAFGAAGSL